jgi:hypothetical protein
MMCGLVDSTYLVGGGDGSCSDPVIFIQPISNRRPSKKKIANFGI